MNEILDLVQTALKATFIGFLILSYLILVGLVCWYTYRAFMYFYSIPYKLRHGSKWWEDVRKERETTYDISYALTPEDITK